MLRLVVKKRVFPFFFFFFAARHPPPPLISVGYLSRRCSTTIESPTDLKPPHHFMVDHLTTTWGFSPDSAARISKRLLHLKSPEKPDAVLRFLTNLGLSSSHIKTVILWNPTLLHSSPDNTLAPNLRALRDIGLSLSAITLIFLSSAGALQYRAAVPRIKFWRDLLGTSDEAALVRVFKQNRGLIGRDITNNIAPKISFLQGHGLSIHDIRRMLVTVPQIMTRNIASMENLLNRAKELGFRTESGGMFVVALQALTCATSKVLQKKKALLKSFGWSEDEFHSAVRKGPTILTLSEENLRAKMDFLVGEVGCDPSYIATHPLLLAYSLDKRLRPRHQVLCLLESKGLSGKRLGFGFAISLSDRKFAERCILPHEKEISGLHEAYLAACASGSRLSQAESSVGSNAK